MLTTKMTLEVAFRYISDNDLEVTDIVFADDENPERWYCDSGEIIKIEEETS